MFICGREDRFSIFWGCSRLLFMEAGVRLDRLRLLLGVFIWSSYRIRLGCGCLVVGRIRGIGSGLEVGGGSRRLGRCYLRGSLLSFFVGWLRSRIRVRFRLGF